MEAMATTAFGGYWIDPALLQLHSGQFGDFNFDPFSMPPPLDDCNLALAGPSIASIPAYNSIQEQNNPPPPQLNSSPASAFEPRATDSHRTRQRKPAQPAPVHYEGYMLERAQPSPSTPTSWTGVAKRPLSPSQQSVASWSSGDEADPTYAAINRQMEALIASHEESWITTQPLTKRQRTIVHNMASLRGLAHEAVNSGSNGLRRRMLIGKLPQSRSASVRPEAGGSGHLASQSPARDFATGSEVEFMYQDPIDASSQASGAASNPSFTRPQRHVVIQPSASLSNDAFQAVPIITYSGNAASSTGIEQSHHAIYTGSDDTRTGRRRRLPSVPGGYVCTSDGCDKSFDTASSLRKHEVKHKPGEHARYLCPEQFCSRDFRYPKDVRRHLSKVHGRSSAEVMEATKNLVTTRTVDRPIIVVSVGTGERFPSRHHPHPRDPWTGCNIGVISTPNELGRRIASVHSRNTEHDGLPERLHRHSPQQISRRVQRGPQLLDLDCVRHKAAIRADADLSWAMAAATMLKTVVGMFWKLSIMLAVFRLRWICWRYAMRWMAHRGCISR